jgi:murein DD-endopeptidase MepM/ murein hydrolase activator NlpD
MAIGNAARHALGAAGLWVLLTLLLAGCGSRFGGPAPVISGAESASQTPPGQVVVQHGQTLSGLAHTYHVPMYVLADANHLSPPYRILVGQALIIPGGGEPASSGPSVAMATPPLPPASNPGPPNQPEPPPVAPIPLDRPPAAAPARPPASLAPPTALTAPMPAPPGGPGSPSPRTAETTLSPLAAPAPPAGSAAAAPSLQPPASAGALAAAEPPAAPRGGGIFLWPVRGHIVESYGAGPDGTHNDGINIAAPRGAAVQAADAGVVAYAGNELRGYGNLILIKHANGWISAYAHCDLVLVKSGQKVTRGQVIARVGSTGNVTEPQLHFELRRGKHAVDPREYLSPLPTAAADRGSSRS